MDPELLELLPILASVVIVAVVVVVAIRNSGLASLAGVGRAKWSEAVRTVAEEYGLEFESVPTAFDRARGDVGRSTVTIEYGSEDDYDGLVMELEVFNANLADALVLRRPRAKLHRDEAVGPLQSTGDAEFDAKVEIAGAPDPVLRLLRDDASTRGLVRKLVIDHGATLAGREIQLLSRKFCESATELRELVEPMIELMARLERPDAKRPTSRTGTPWAVRIRKAERQPDEPKMAELRAFFESLAPRFEGAKVYRPAGENELDVRGSIRGRPLRIEMAWTLGLEFTVRTSKAPHGVWLYQDPDVRRDAEQPPEWDGGSSSKQFVSEAVYLEGTRSELKRRKAAVDALPADVRAAILRAMPDLGIRYFRIDGSTVWAMLWPDLDELSDPEATILDVANLLARTAECYGPATDEETDVDDEDDDEDDES